ncbi:DUF2637 domain-containing protein [Saccharopolyspora shandongensis]|uniref:DUF2637 domain-containing protein n=1 Tax=Saccharopolyspora shandongensis TaxID=418495 RepID=UPI000A92C29E|nr:DUF2637 domain-containing protein [Saccharopolyspora shandongensis]
MTWPGRSSLSHDRALLLQCACTILVAAGAAYVSYQHGRQFALRFGADRATAAIWPLIVDGLLTIATVELWKAGPCRPAGRWKAWLAFLLGIGLSLCANVASAPELSVFAVAVAACPPLALLLSVELLNQALKRHRGETAASVGKRDGDQAPTNRAPTEPDGMHSSTADALTGEADPTECIPEHNVPGQGTATGALTSEVSQAVGHDPLFEQACELDSEHWDNHKRPIAADTLRRQLGIGSDRARALTRHVRQRHQLHDATQGER